MTIQIYGSNQRRTTSKNFAYDISRWSSFVKKQDVYTGLAKNADSDMMKSDSIIFKPGEMYNGSGRTLAELDPSFATREMMGWRPTFVTVGAIAAFLLFLNYLRTKQ